MLHRRRLAHQRHHLPTRRRLRHTAVGCARELSFRTQRG